jgi:prepilin-type N-terminal cleavage/methylation domain-containing protein
MNASKPSKGFTLIELLVVVSILAASSVIAVNLYYSTDGGSVDSRVQRQLAQVEMMNIANAIRRFKQDTGFYPGQGPFSYLDYEKCGDSCNCTDDAEDSIGGLDPEALEDLAGPYRGVANPRDWHEMPANLVQLLIRPVICPEHPLAGLESWNEVSQRGWRGPYITHEGFTDISDDLSPSGNGDPVAPGILAVRNIPAIADPFNNNSPESVSTVNVDGDGFLLDWRSFTASTNVYDSGEIKPGRPGSAYYLFGQDGCTPLRIVSMGENGVYDSNLGTDDYDPYQFTPAKDKCSPADREAIGTENLRPLVCQPQPGSDDLVMCL